MQSTHNELQPQSLSAELLYHETCHGIIDAVHYTITMDLCFKLNNLFHSCHDRYLKHRAPQPEHKPDVDDV